MKRILITLWACCALSSFLACQDNDDHPQKNTPLIIAHRGAQSVLPEHTLEAYRKGIELGADFIEPDLVLTKDGHLVVRHEPMLSGTTNVADLPQFAHLKTTKNLDGKMVTDWFAIDFSLAEIKQLKAKQAYPGRPKNYDNQFDIPTFEEVIEIAKKNTSTRSKEIGIYPEIKHPYFHNQKFGAYFMENTLISVLKKHQLHEYEAPIFVQCFEVAPLQYINQQIDVRLVQLISTYGVKKDGRLNFDLPEGDFISYVAPYDFHQRGDMRTYAYFSTPEGMKYTAQYADGIGPWKPFIISYKTAEDGKITLNKPSNFIKLAHQYGLKVHPYTFRNENTQWSSGTAEKEYHLFFDAGVDGVFTDYTDEAVRALKSWKKKN